MNVLLKGIESISFGYRSIKTILGLCIAIQTNQMVGGVVQFCHRGWLLSTFRLALKRTLLPDKLPSSSTRPTTTPPPRMIYEKRKWLDSDERRYKDSRILILQSMLQLSLNWCSTCFWRELKDKSQLWIPHVNTPCVTWRIEKCSLLSRYLSQQDTNWAKTNSEIVSQFRVADFTF